jgi:hypothetical protein
MGIPEGTERPLQSFRQRMREFVFLRELCIFPVDGRCRGTKELLGNKLRGGGTDKHGCWIGEGGDEHLD